MNTKFRALKDDMSGCNWVYGNLIYDCYGNPRIQENIDTDLLFTTCLKGTESKFTGLTDKNGKEIYEGDIVKRNDNVVKCVFYNEKFAGFYTKFSNGAGFIDPLTYATDRQCEIIGNIYETPELLTTP